MHTGLTGFYGINKRSCQNSSRAIIKGVELGTLHPPGICKMSKINMLIRNDLHEDNIMKLSHEKSKVAIGRERVQ